MGINWDSFFKLKKQRKFEKELESLYGPRKYETITIPREVCSVCNGTNKVFESGDLHRSSGIIPCPAYFCEGGYVTKKRVEIKRRIRVKANSRVLVAEQ